MFFVFTSVLLKCSSVSQKSDCAPVFTPVHQYTKSYTNFTKNVAINGDL